MTTFREYLDENLLDTDFSTEWEAQAPEREIMKEIARERERAGMTQEELANRVGMRQSNLSRLENGNGNPSVQTLSKIARGLGKKLEIHFV